MISVSLTVFDRGTAKAKDGTTNDNNHTGTGVRRKPYTLVWPRLARRWAWG